MNTQHRARISEILPGAFLLVLLLFSYFNLHSDQWDSLISKNSAIVIASGVAAFIVVWIVGTLLDATRNLLEHFLWDKQYPPALNWDFFFTGENDKVHQLDEYYYAYYQLDANFAVAIISFFMIEIFFGLILGKIAILPALVNVSLLIPLLIFALDAKILRSEIKPLLGNAKENSNLPHEGVYTRLQCSNIHGVGVFAVRDIPKGTNLFCGDESEIVWVDRQEITGLEPGIRKLYADFCIIKGDKYGCPKNFNNLTVAWYLNESRDNPNVSCTDSYDFIAIRDIKKGEELTVDYSTYSEYPER